MNRPAAVTNPANNSKAIKTGRNGSEEPPLGSVRTFTEKAPGVASAASAAALDGAAVDGAALSDGKAVLVTVDVRVRVAARAALAAAAA